MGKTVTQKEICWETRHPGRIQRRQKSFLKHWLDNKMCEFYRKSKVEDANKQSPEKNVV